MLEQQLKLVSLILTTTLLFSHPSSLAAVQQAGRYQARTTGTKAKPQPQPPKSPLEHNNLGVSLGMKGLWTEAIKEHQIALNGDPENQTFRQNLSGAELRYGELLARQGKKYEAMTHLREALYADPSNAEADKELDNLVIKVFGKNDLSQRLRLADEADVNGNYPVAIVEYRKCVSMSERPLLMAKLGRALIKQGKIVDGYLQLRNAVGKTWEDSEKDELADCHRQLGEILKEYADKANEDNRTETAAKRLSNAAIEFRRAITLNPAKTETARGLVEVAREAVAINPSFDNHLMLGGAYQLFGDYDRAKMEYETCWRINKNSPALALARRSFHLSVVSHPRSPVLLAATVQKVEDNLRQNPNDAELLYIYARGKEAQGESEQAIKAYQAALTINPLIYPDLKERLNALVNGSSTKGTGQPNTLQNEKTGHNENIGHSESTTSSGNNNTSILTSYAEIESKLRSNQLDEAEKLATTLVEKDPKNARAWLFLGRIHEKKGELDQASVAYRQATYLKEPEAKVALLQIDSSRVQPLLKEADEASNQHNWVAASAALKDALTVAPNLSIVHRKLAETLRQLGDVKESQREAKRADDLDNEKN